MSRIVIVDDQKTNGEALAQLAATLEADAQVCAFADPLEALSDIFAQPPDLLIADGHIAGMDADEFLRRFRDAPDCEQVPAVVVTAYETAAFRGIAFEEGTTEILLAPIDHDEFRLRSRNLLSIHRARQITTHAALAARARDEADAAENAQVIVDRISMFNGLIQTLSSKLLSKINELDRCLGEIQTLAAVTKTPAIFVDDNLRIRHFTSQISGIYNISSQDIGKHLAGIDTCLMYAKLEEDFRDSMMTGKVIEKYLERRDNSGYFLMRISPNYSKDRSVWGATITFAKTNTWYRGNA